MNIRFLIFLIPLLLTSCYKIIEGDETMPKVIYVNANDKQNTESTLINKEQKELKEKVYYPLGIIGAVEPVYLKDMNSVFYARIDTGATTSSLDATEITRFERDGEDWVSFVITNAKTKETKKFEKKVARKISIKRQSGNNESRVSVNMEIKFGNQQLVKEFTLVHREDFNYQVLIGRNILNGLAVVDVATSNTLN